MRHITVKTDFTDRLLPMIELTLLGTVDARTSDGRAIDSLSRSPKRLALLSWLVLHGAFQRRDTILALLWPELDQGGGRGALRSLLRLLRKDVGEGVLVSRGKDSIGLTPGAVRCDAVSFQNAVEEGRFQEALELYQGDLLSGFFVREAPDFEEWLELERQRLREMAIRAATSASRAAEDRGDLVEAARAARRATGLAPWDEPAAVRLIGILGKAGSAGAAKRAFDRLADYLRTELELDPSPSTVAALEQALALAEKGGGSSPLASSAASAAPFHARTVSEAEREDVSESATETPTEVLAEDRAEERDEPAPEPRSVPLAAPGFGPLNLRMLVAVLAVLTLLVAAQWIKTGGSDGAAPLRGLGDPESRVAILPFTVEGGTEEEEYLSAGMVDLLSAKLDIPGVVRPVDARVGALEGEVRESAPEQAGRRAAELLGAGSFIRGSVVPEGDRIHLLAQWAGRDGEPLARASVAVEAGALLAGVDSLVRALLADRYDTPAAEVRRAAAVTTTSIPALRHFVSGEHAFREGRFGEASDAFRAALQYDSAFALADLRLAQAWEWLDQPARLIAALARADRHRDRLTLRLQYILDARTAFWEGRTVDALRAYESLLQNYPYDVEGLYGRGDLLFHGGPSLGRPILESREDFEQVVVLDPENHESLLHLARLSAMEGRDEDVLRYTGALRGARGLVAAETETLRLLAGGPVSPQAWHDLSGHPGLQGLNRPTVVVRVVEARPNRPEAMEMLGLLMDATEPTTRAGGRMLRALLLASQGRISEADRALVEAGREVPEMEWTTRAALAVASPVPFPGDDAADLLASMPRFPEEYNTAAAQPTLRATALPATGRYFRGLLLVLSGRNEEAEEVARVFEAAGDPFSEQTARTLRAFAAYRGGATERAARLVLEERAAMAEQVAMFGLGAFLYAEILRESGHPEQALTWYDCVLSDLRHDIYYRVLARLRAAQVLELLGRPAEALVAYRDFLAAWRAPDPGAERLAGEARAAVARLTS